MVESEMGESYQGEEPEEVVTVLVSLAELGIKDSGGDDLISITEEDYDVLLLDLSSGDMDELEYPAFVVQQTHSKLRTWKENKELNRNASRDRSWIYNRTAKG